MRRGRFALLAFLCALSLNPVLRASPTPGERQANAPKPVRPLSEVRPSKYSGPLPRGEFRDDQVELPSDASRRQVRESRYKGSYPEVGDPNDTNPAGPLEESVTVISDYAGHVDPLPASRAAAIVVGTILDGKAFVSNDRNYVYSDFHVRIEQVLKQDPSANLAVGGQLVASRGGGTIHFPSGRFRSYTNHGEGMPAVGSRYLLFLVKANIPEPEYEVIIGAAYELRNGKVHPLDDISAEFDNTDEPQFVARVGGAIDISNGGKQ